MRSPSTLPSERWPCGLQHGEKTGKQEGPKALLWPSCHHLQEGHAPLLTASKTPACTLALGGLPGAAAESDGKSQSSSRLEGNLASSSDSGGTVEGLKDPGK